MDIRAFRRVDDVEIFWGCFISTTMIYPSFTGLCCSYRFLSERVLLGVPLLRFHSIFFSLPSSVLPDLYYFHLAVLRDWG